MEAPSSSQTCKVLDCAVAPVVHIIMENGSKAPKAIRMAPEGAPTPQGLALYVITEEIIVSLPALTHRQRGMIKIRGSVARYGALDRLVPRIRTRRVNPEPARSPWLASPLRLSSPTATLRLRQPDWSPFWWKWLSRQTFFCEAAFISLWETFSGLLSLLFPHEFIHFVPFCWEFPTAVLIKIDI